MSDTPKTAAERPDLRRGGRGYRRRRRAGRRASSPWPRPRAGRARRPSLGGFGALFDLKAAGYDDPLLVSTTDGVGTKLKIAIETGRHDTRRHRPGRHVRQRPAGPGRRAAAVPRLLRHRQAGRRRRHAAWSPASPRAAARPAAPWSAARRPRCRACTPSGDYDLAGFSRRRGRARRACCPGWTARQAGDLMIGLASSGPHSNGYSLIRKVVERSGLAWDDAAPVRAGDRSWPRR